MVSLAAHHGDGPVSVDTIVDEQGISANYVHVLMGGLKTAGLVRSIRGPNGGYELTRTPAEVTAFDIVTVLEGDTMPVECVAEPSGCPRAATCPTRKVWRQMSAAMDAVLKGLTVETLVQDQGGQPDYCI